MKRNALLTLTVLCSALVTGTISAREIAVADPTHLSVMDAALPGDVLILKNGTWKDAKLYIKKGGEVNNPVLIKAETPGGVVLSGSSSLVIAAPYVTVDGLLFKDGALAAKGRVIWFKSHHGIVQNTAIIDYNPAEFRTKYHWVSFSGPSNLVARCYFKGKNNAGPLVVNDEPDCRYNSLTGSYFKDIPLKAKSNGRETVKIMGAGHVDAASPDGAYFTLEGNLFERADGEGVEVISIKSNHNKVLRNTIIASAGCLNIRRGSYNEIKDNVILGQGVNRAQGIQMSGEHNLIQGNFVSGCEYGIAVSSGEYWEKALTPKYIVNDRDGTSENKAHYPQNKHVTIINNMTVGNSGPDLNLGENTYKKHWPENQNILIPEECRIENNIFVRPKGGVSVIGVKPDTNPPLDRFSFKPNIYVGNLLYGGENGFAPSASGFRSQAIPSGWTLQKAIAASKPLTPADVGPDWVRAKGL